MMGRNKSSALQFIKDRWRDKINTRHGKFLSRAGQEVLLKNVAQAFPTYTMNVFLFPLAFCQDSETMMNKYWWRHSNSTSKGVTWMSWDRLIKQKSQGGIGFRKLHKFNLALLGKQSWWLLTKPESLIAKVLKARYFPSCFVLDALLGANPSYTWRSIYASIYFLKKGVR